MRKRELIARLKDDEREFRRSRGQLFFSQEAERRRLDLHQALERLLPEIIEKLESPQ